MNYIFNNIIISSESKIEVIITKIKAHSSIEELKELISQVEEISELAMVWDGNWPELDNNEKKLLSEELSKAGYIKIFKRKEKTRIKKRKFN